MAILSGNVVRLNTFDVIYNASGAMVTVIQGRKPVAHGKVDADENFEFELPEDLRGEIEVRVDLHGAAPVTATADGGDIAVTVLYNNQQQFA